MRVYIISANWGHGGPGGIAADLYHTVVKNGHACRFAYARETVPEEVNSYQIGTMLDVYAHALMSRLFDNAGFLSTGATKALIRDIQAFQPDIINIHNPLGYTMHVGVLLDFIRESGIPTVWTLHDCWAFTGHCTTDICPRMFEGCGACPHTKEFPKSLFLDRSAQNLKRKQQRFGEIENLYFVGPSQWICNLAKQSYLKSNEILCIPNGIDLDVFQPTPSDLRTRYGLEDKILLLAVASIWSKRKGANYLLELMKRIDSRFVLVMIGKMDMPDGEKPDNILWIDRTENRTQLAQWYSAADIFVNPTVGDNFPTVNLEALACGTPIVTFDTGGSAESVGTCGCVVKRNDSDALMDAIHACLAAEISPEQCIEQSKKYSKQDRYRDYLLLFERILHPNHRP